MSQVDWAIGGSVGGGSYRGRNVLLELCLRRCGTDCSTWVATTNVVKRIYTEVMVVPSHCDHT